MKSGQLVFLSALAGVAGGSVARAPTLAGVLFGVLAIVLIDVVVYAIKESK